MPLSSAKSTLNPFESHHLRSKVFKLIQQRSFSKGRFTLASGVESNYYLDLKPTMLDAEGADGLAELILNELYGMNVDYVGGLAVGAVSLLGSIQVLSHRKTKPIPGFYVRKEIKDHGTMKLVEGLAPGETLHGKRVVILDDVTTTGCSAMIAAKAAQDAGASVILVLSIVDRQEGAAEFYEKAGIPFKALFTAREFLDA
jgi:orotate phosphoribosyltransferase